MSIRHLRIEERVLREGEYFVDHDTTVRATARYFGLSKTRIHADLTEILGTLDDALYQKAKARLEQNKKDAPRRGGEGTKQKYLRRR